MSTSVLKNLLNKTQSLTIDERLLLIKHLIESIRQIHPPTTMDEIESACGILQASHSVNLEQMEEAIKQRGGQQWLR